MRVLACALLACLLLPPGAGAADSWKKKNPAAWTAEEALAVLTDSPWARRVTVWQVTGRKLHTVERSERIYQDAPGEPAVRLPQQRVISQPEVVEGRYAVSWSSAAILTQAWERLRQMGSEALAGLHLPPPEGSTRHYILTVRVLKPPAGPAQPLIAGLSEAQLLERARLRTSNERELAPERLLRHGLGAGAGVSFFFPREQDGQATLPPRTSWAEFVFENSLGDQLKAKFKLKDMRFQGRPDY